jgi:hypothetical protein
MRESLIRLNLTEIPRFVTTPLLTYVGGDKFVLNVKAAAAIDTCYTGLNSEITLPHKRVSIFVEYHKDEELAIVLLSGGPHVLCKDKSFFTGSGESQFILESRQLSQYIHYKIPNIYPGREIDFHGVFLDTSDKHDRKVPQLVFRLRRYSAVAKGD